MSILFYVITVCFVLNVALYFHSGISVILTLFIVILLIILCKVVNLPLLLSAKCSSDNSRGYKNLRINMSNSERNLNTPERNKSLLGIGLFSNYDSRLGHSRSSLKSSSSISENFHIRSPNRTYSKVNNLPSDENYVSKQPVSSAESEMPSPIRKGLSPFRSTPLSYSKRFNVNPQSSPHISPHRLNQSRFSSLRNNSLSKTPQSPDSSTQSLNREERSTSFSRRMMTVAHQMDNDQFPWIAYNGSIPMIISESQKASSPGANVSSPSSDANSSFRNRVRVRLSKPNKSDKSVSNSTIDNSSILDESSTTKSVIQVLKEIARKRSLATEEEEEHEDQPQAKRRTEHNLYLSRLEGEEEEQVPLSKLRLNGEDERMKRTREPDWDTSSVSNPKRPRKSYNFVNNEIISSLSSSIGLQTFKQSQRKKSTRKSIAIQVQTLVPEENIGEKKETTEKSSQLPKSSPKTRDAGVETDPLPEPRSRSPVKEKVVSDVKGILKSALKKFDIQPSASANMGSDKMVTSPINSSPPVLADASSQASSSSTLLTPFSSANQSAIPAPIISETTSGSFNLTTSKSTSESVSTVSNAFTIPASAPPITFGVASTVPDKEPKAVTTNESKQELLPKATMEKVGFKAENKDASKTESSFKISVASSDSKAEPSVSQPQVTSSGLFNYKAPDTSASISTQAPSTASSSSIFSFGTPKISDASNKAKTTEERNSVFGSTFNTPVTSSMIPVTSAIQPQNTSLPALTTSKSSEQKAKLSKSPVFTFQNKPSELVKSSTDDKKNPVASGIFNFGESENKLTPTNSKSETKPFQFGSGGFTFGQAGNKGSSDSSNIAASQPVSSAPLVTGSSTQVQPVFSFSSSSAKKDANAGGFTFNAVVTTSNDQKSLFNFNTSSSFGSTSNSTKSTFPTSLFSNNPKITNTSTGTTAKVNDTLTSNASVMTSTFGSATSKAAPAFGLSTVSSSAPTIGSTVTSTAPTFGNTTPSTAPAFGNTTTASTFGNTATSTAPTFGSVAATTASTFGSTEAPKSVFGSMSNQPSFGNSVTNAPVFGSNITTNEANKPSVFGSSSTITSPPTFGASSASNTVPTFGSVAAGTNTNSTFGNSGGTVQPTFASSATGLSNNPTFGSTTTNANVPTFGSGAGSAFGSTTVGSTFSSGTTATGTNPSPFGASSAGPGPSAPGFSGTNNTPSFGSTPAFGSTPSVPAFGTSSTSTFGNSATTTPAFGNQTQPIFGGQSGTSFGTATFGQTSTTPSFGTQNTFSTQTSTPAFGSTPTPAFGSSTTFGSTSVPGSTPAFGTTPAPAFGSSTTFGSQDTSKPFTFNAPASQTAQAGTFNFTTPQPQPSSGGLFQFGAGSTGAPSNQPFQFNASQSSAPGFTAGFSPGVGGTGQQMFSIGSGSTAPRRMTGRRKK